MHQVYIVFDGLDTAAHVRLNGNEIGFANNQFRQWMFDATGYLESEATLEVEFESAIKYALGVFESIGAPYTVFTNYFWTYPEGREYIRKVGHQVGLSKFVLTQQLQIQSDFGWDWGPHFSPSGIYRDAYLVGIDDGFAVANTFIDIYKVGQHPNTIPDQTAPWTVNVSLDYLSALECSEVTTKVSVASIEHEVTSASTGDSGLCTHEVSFNVSNDKVVRWWPCEFGMTCRSACPVYS